VVIERPQGLFLKIDKEGRLRNKTAIRFVESAKIEQK